MKCVGSYVVFPGITLTFQNEETYYDLGHSGESFVIAHCREGRAEFGLGDGFGYLSPGDLLVSDKASTENDWFFPLGRYLGIMITVDTKAAPGCLSCVLDDIDVSPRSLRSKFCSGDGFIARSNDSIGHIFSELYNVPESIRDGYFKVKILELFLFLSAMETDFAMTSRHSVSRTHMELARSVSRYLTSHMDERITLERLSTLFHISGTQIKQSFREVYGVSIYSFTRTEKMRAAARMLIESDSTVLDIAGRFGYDNGSKFAGAFRDVMGMSPKEYRFEKIRPNRVEKCPNGVETCRDA